MTPATFLLLAAVIAAASWALGSLGRHEAIDDANREEARADLAVASLRRALRLVKAARATSTEWPCWIREPRRDRFVPPAARVRQARRELEIR